MSKLVCLLAEMPFRMMIRLMLPELGAALPYLCVAAKMNVRHMACCPEYCKYITHLTCLTSTIALLMQMGSCNPAAILELAKSKHVESSYAMHMFLSGNSAKGKGSTGLSKRLRRQNDIRQRAARCERRYCE